MVVTGSAHRQCGVGYVYMLMAVFLLSLGLGKVLDVYSSGEQREREAELMYVGGLYRNAIRDYYLSAPDGQRRYPMRLEDLLKDPRHLVTRRYLRQLYRDPMTSLPFTLLMAPQGGIWGVVSSSAKTPLRSAPIEFVAPREDSTRSYRDWQFLYRDGGPQ